MKTWTKNDGLHVNVFVQQRIRIRPVNNMNSKREKDESDNTEHSLFVDQLITFPDWKPDDYDFLYTKTCFDHVGYYVECKGYY